MSDAFVHVDAARTVVFGFGALARAQHLLGEGYTLLTTPRAAAAAPEVAALAGLVIDVPHGPVDLVAERLRAATPGHPRSATPGHPRSATGADRIVALGGGRVIDVAKALAAAEGPLEVAAIPTSLSGAEMTGVHRHARGVPEHTPRARPVLVINDPRLSASHSEEGLAASSANALGHATTAVFSDLATPISRAVGGEAIERLVSGWSVEEPDRATLALGALLAGWAVDHSGLGPHHALAQSAVRVASLEHARTNAALLPATIGAIRARRPREMERVDKRLGVALESVARRLRERSGADLGALASDEDLLEHAINLAESRPELERIPPPPDRAEIRNVYYESAGRMT